MDIYVTKFYCVQSDLLSLFVSLSNANLSKWSVGYPINFGINCNSFFFSTKELPGQSSIIEEEQWNFHPVDVSPSCDSLKR